MLFTLINLVPRFLVGEAKGEIWPSLINSFFDWLINPPFRDACTRVKIARSNDEYYSATKHTTENFVNVTKANLMSVY